MYKESLNKTDQIKINKIGNKSCFYLAIQNVYIIELPRHASKANLEHAKQFVFVFNICIFNLMRHLERICRRLVVEEETSAEESILLLLENYSAKHANNRCSQILKISH